MKRIVSILCVACLLTTGSCKKFLDLPSQSDYDSNNIFENADRVEMALLGAYTSVFNTELYYQLGMGTDECFSTEGETNSKNQVSNYVYTPATSPSSTYTAMYSGVEQANVLIKNIPLMQPQAEAGSATWGIAGDTCQEYVECGTLFWRCSFSTYSRRRCGKLYFFTR